MRMKKNSETQRAMERVWARHTLKAHPSTCECIQCKDAKSILKDS